MTDIAQLAGAMWLGGLWFIAVCWVAVIGIAVVRWKAGQRD